MTGWAVCSPELVGQPGDFLNSTNSRFFPKSIASRSKNDFLYRRSNIDFKGILPQRVCESSRIRQNFFYLRQLLDFSPESFEGLGPCDSPVLNRICDQLNRLFKFPNDLLLLLKFVLRTRGKLLRIR